MSFDEINFAKRLKEERKRMNLTQQALAERWNISHDCISKYENGTAQVPLDILVKYALLFNLSTDYLLTGEERGNNRDYKYLIRGLDQKEISEFFRILRLFFDLLRSLKQRK